MAHEHCYRVLLGDDYTSKWVRVWALNIEDVYNVCMKLYPAKYVEEVQYIK